MSSSPSLSATDFPYFQYTSLLGTHTLLLAFTAVILPRGTLLITPLPPQQSSLDKPQSHLLEPITASPVWTLLWLCVGTGVCQAWWGGWMRVLWATYPHHHGGGGNSGGDTEGIARGDGVKIEALRNAWINTLFASALFHVIIILFGAPISSYIARTYLLSLLLSILTVFVPSYSLSLPITLNPFIHESGLQWIRLFIQRKIHTAVERALVLPVLGSILGSWAGAFPIPLDWDRPWQAWPLTPAYGALAGYILGSWSSLIINVVLFFAVQDVPQHHADVVPATGGPKTTKKRNKKKRE